MIAIIDYGVGNLASLQFALSDLAIDFLVSSDPVILRGTDQLILPGVGHAQFAMRQLIDRGLDDYIRSTNQPLLGICLGMQLLFESSAESDIPLLGIIPGRLEVFGDANLPKTHMGWNRLSTGELMYFVHSFRVELSNFTVATADYGERFTAVVKKDQYTGVQFHPEKSGKSGLRYLKQLLIEPAIC